VNNKYLTGFLCVAKIVCASAEISSRIQENFYAGGNFRGCGKKFSCLRIEILSYAQADFDGYAKKYALHREMMSKRIEKVSVCPCKLGKVLLYPLEEFFCRV
jgi:hypothetical protein